MRQTSRPRTTVTLQELPAPALTTLTTRPTGPEQAVFVTNAVRRRGGLRARGEQAAVQHRPVLVARVG